MIRIRALSHQVPFLVIGLLATAGRAPAVDLIGFVPDYRMNATYINNTLPDQLAMLDAVAYFGISVNGSGNLTTTSTDLNNIASIKSIIDGMPASERPRLDITIGGAGEDTVFSNIANTAAERTQFAEDLDALLDQTGAGGVQIDWEHPDPGIERTTYYPAMLKRIKEEFGANRTVGATVAPSVVISNSVFSGSDAIDSVSLMTYDLGWWGNDPSNPNDGEHSLPEYVEDAAQAWTDSPGSPNQRPWVFGTWGNDAPADKLGVGLPFYGRGVFGGGAYTYSELVSGGSTSDGNYYSYSGQTVWIPGPDLVEQRVEFADEQGLNNIIIWELAQDLHPDNANSLLRAAYETKLSLEPIPGDYDGDGTVGPGDYSLWRETFGSTEDLRADGNGNEIIDAADYAFWRDIVEAAGTGSGQVAAIAEPSAGSLALLAIMMSVFLPRRPRRPG